MIESQTIKSNELVEKCLSGDRKAQTLLYDRYANAMYTICYRLMGNADDAQEALQEAFISVFRHLNTYRGDSTLGAWIKQIVSRSCIGLLRRRNKLVVSTEDSSNFGAEADPEGIELNNSDEGVRRVKRAISELADGYRVVLSLYLIEGYDHGEIAQILNISENTSKSQYSRAKKKLKQMLAQA